MGYRFTTGKIVQTQPVKAAANARLQTSFAAGGSVVITETREATEEERENRRLSARQSSEIRTRTIEQVGDYLLLPESKRDLYLSGAHGITSQYPVMLLTTPRTAEKIDISSDLTTTPFIIDLNNEIKKSIESKITSTIARYTTPLGLSNAEYNQTLGIARQYADFSLTAARFKDRIISLTNVINVANLGGPNQSQNVVIDSENYQFLRGLPDVLTFFKFIDNDFTRDTFTLGTNDNVNTKALAQIFKVLYNQFLLGNFEQSDADPDVLRGKVNKEINDLVVKLKLVEREPDKFSEIPYNEYDLFKNADKLTDLVRIIQRDLIIQSAQSELNSLSLGGDTGLQALGTLIGDYKDQDSTSATILKQGYLTIQDFIEGDGEDEEVKNFLIKKQFNNAGSFLSNFNVLDYVGGHDYLLYDELSSESNNVSLNNLRSFANEYSLFALRLRVFYQAIYRDDETRQKCLSIIVSNFLSFFTTAQITKSEFTSEKSAARAGILMLAAKSNAVAERLFELLCVQDKGYDDGIYRNSLYNILIADFDIENPGTLSVSSTIADGGVGKFEFKKDYLDGGPGTSFGMFHAIAREIEDALSNDNLSPGSQKFTFYSLNLTRNARAFVIYQLFLDILRNFTFNVTTDEARTNEMQIKYEPDQYKSIRFALENYDKSIPDFLSSLENTNFVQSSTADAAALEAVNYKYRLDARSFFMNYFYTIRRKINEQEQNCLDLVNLLINHSTQLLQSAATLNDSVSSMRRIANENNIANKESLLNSIQLEQAELKRNLVDKYTNTLRGASYLPAAIDYNIGQGNNTKTVVATYPVLTDPTDSAITRKFLVVVGLPTGLIESLRYQNTANIDAHLFSIDLVFKNLQISQEQQQTNETSVGYTMPGTEIETDNEGSDAYILKSFTFSTRVFIDEGSIAIGGADTRAPELTAYEQVFNATKFKVFTDEGSYTSLTYADLTRLLGADVVNNHIASHYGKLFLKSTTGVAVDEEVFDLIPQQREYPDSDKIPLYTTLADDISANFSTSTENQLNKERTLRDLSRAIYVSPQQHKTSAMVSKTFERLYVIPIDIGEFLGDPAIGITENDVAFIDVAAKIRLAEAQPPVSLEPTSTRRAYANALGESGIGSDLIRQIDVEAQSVASVGISKMFESANRHGGRLGGYRR